MTGLHRLPIVGCVLLAAAGPTPDASADPAGPAELDVAVLATSAGACKSTQPAWIATWCRPDAVKPREFTSTYVTTSVTASERRWCVSMPVIDVGKGFIPSPVQPNVDRDGQYAKQVSFSVRGIDRHRTDAVRAARITFAVRGHWRRAAWWGPKTTIERVTLIDGAGRDLGNSTAIRAGCSPSP